MKNRRRGNGAPLLPADMGSDEFPNCPAGNEMFTSDEPFSRRPEASFKGVRLRLMNHLASHFAREIPVETIDEILRIFIEEDCDAMTDGGTVSPVQSWHHYRDRLRELEVGDFTLAQPPCYLCRSRFLQICPEDDCEEPSLCTSKRTRCSCFGTSQ